MNDRRRFLSEAAALAAACSLPRSVVGAGFWDQPRTLWLVRQETHEQVQDVYWQNGQLNVAGFTRLCHLMRDVRANQAVQMHVTLLDILRAVQGWLWAYNVRRPIIVNSGYRSPQTNRLLQREGAAKNSMHLYGRAADITVPGLSPQYLAQLGSYLRGGGVGFYPAKGFVHLDTGNVRVWRG